MVNKTINILFVLPNFDTGGSEKLVVDLVMHLDRSKFNPVVCAFFSGVYKKQMQELGISFHEVHVDGVRKNKFQIVKFLNKIIRDYEIDVVNAHHTSSLLQGLASFKLFNRVKLIHTEHTRLDLDPNITSRAVAIQKVFMKFVDTALGISNGVCEYFEKELGVPKRKIVKILNGVHVEKFRFSKDEGLRMKDEYRRRLGIGEQDIVVGMFANFRAQKNHPLLLKAVKILKDKGNNIKVVLAGDGPEEPACRELVRELGLQDHILFLGPRHDIPELMNAIDIYCLPSHFEGLPFSLMEAFAAGKKVVATDVIGNKDVVEEMGEGVLVEPDNPEALSSALERQITSSLGASSELGRQGSSALESFPFSFDDMLKNYEQLFLKYGTK